MAVKPLSPSTVPTAEDERYHFTVATMRLLITIANVPDSLALLPLGVAIGCILGSQVQEQKVERNMALFHLYHFWQITFLGDLFEFFYRSF